MRFVIGLCLLALAAPVLASNPGEPLDCSDWVFMEAGLTCSTFAAIDDVSTSLVWGRGKGASAVTDNAGRLITLKFLFTQTYTGSSVNTLGQIEVIGHDGGAEVVIARIADRVHPGGQDQIRPSYYRDWSIDRGASPYPDPGPVQEALVFDSVNGRLFVFVRAYCLFGCTNTYSVESILVLEGFTPLFDILQTYTPTANNLSFRVPYMPEGNQYADWFDTYTGDLATIGDWSQLQPLQCGYPATAPNVGDYLSVADTLPTPAIGTGRYYLTVANYMGERRFGRKVKNGQLSGRDASNLPACP